MPRLAAWKVLRSGSTTPLRSVDAHAAGLDERDRGLVRAIVGHEVRRRGTLRAVVRHLSERSLKPDLAAHLHVGLTQVLFLDRVPPHAAVSETLGAVERTLGQSKVPLVNAILRNALRMRRDGAVGDPRRDLVGRDAHLADAVFRDPSEHPLLWAEDALSCPSQLLKRWTKRHGRERAEALARAALTEPPVCVRGVGLDRDQTAAALEAVGIPSRAGAHASSVRIESDATKALLASEPFQAGRLVVQGETALAAAERVGATAGERVLDLCAAPGGKTMALLERGAHVTAVDVSAERLERVRESAARLALTERLTIVEADGTADWDDPTGDAPYDAALVDAPCSNTGVLAARPGARWRFGPSALKQLGAMQSDLLERAAARVRPGGRLVWSTCSLEPEENGQLVRRFLEGHPDWTLEAAHEALPDGHEGSPVDGGGHALLVRSES